MTFFEKKGLQEPMTFFDRKDAIDPMTPVDPSEKRTEFDRDIFLLNLRNQIDDAKRRQESIQALNPIDNRQCNQPIPASTVTENTGNMAQRFIKSRFVESEVVANQGPNTQNFNLLAQHVAVKSKKLKPIDLARKVKSSLILCVKNHEIYAYLNGYYKKMNQSEMEGLIWSICKDEVEQVGNKAILTGAYQLLVVDPALRVESLQSASNVVPFRNGLITLEAGCFIQLTPSYFVTFILNCEFSVGAINASCPNFDKYLSDVSGGDYLLIKRIWEVIGSCLTQDTNIKSIFLFQGITNSGKSVLANLLKALFPTANIK